MANFRVGQRVRIIFAYEDRFKKYVGLETKISAPLRLRGNSDHRWEGYGVEINWLFCPQPSSLEPIIDRKIGSDNRVTAWEVGVSPWVPEHRREKREQPATLEPGLTK